MASSVFDRKAKDAGAYANDAPWVEKFRPKTLDDVAAHKEIIETSEWSHEMDWERHRLQRI